MEIGDQVLFNPEDRYEVEVRGNDYIILRERDIHALLAASVFHYGELTIRDVKDYLIARGISVRPA